MCQNGLRKEGLLHWSAYYESTAVDIDFTAETKSSCFHEMKELAIPYLGRRRYLSYKADIIRDELKVLMG